MSRVLLDRIQIHFVPEIVGRWLIVASVFSLGGISPVRSAVGDVDTRDALVIGTYRVSAYRVTKNYQRYLSPTISRGDNASTSKATRAWFERFLAEQVLTAEALKQGYGERPEVTAEVRRMEHHMLTQFAGPFYERLYSAAPASLQAMDVPLLCRQSSFDAEILRIPKAAPTAEQIRRRFALKTSDDGELDLAAFAASGQVECFSGPIEWPFVPFEEIAGVIGSVPVGRWHELDTGDDLLVFRVCKVRRIPLPPAAQIAPPPIELLQHLRQNRIQRERQRQILQEARLTFDWPAAQRWVDQLAAQHPDPLLPLDRLSAADMATTSIAAFQRDGRREMVTVIDYINDYNDRYLRRLPRNAFDLFDAVRSIIVAQRDEIDARAMGVDREPKFTEDRRNYHDLLALDLYVKERVRPALGVSESEVAGYYRDHLEAFARPLKIAGILLTFNEISDAIVVAQAHDSDSAKAFAPRAQSRKELVLTRNTELPELSFLTGLAFSGRTARVLGPFPNGDAFSVWIFERVLETETPPLTAVSQEIRRKLEEPRLAGYEEELARQLSRGTAIEDNIAYNKYGIGDGILKPWNL